ncbi:MAG TPA: YhjD/YihY/BrkB family envelope integrity protein [Mycobacteriales bacterium]|nr:YhjD/YihY/BrkB family envelope integrity protein [Mycobacteriales bacterium]
MSTEVQPDGAVAQGRVARWRERAERASSNYLRLAERRPFFGLPLVYLARYTARQGVLLASALAFRLFLWVMPLALLIAGVLAGLSDSHVHALSSAGKSAGVTGAASQQIVAALQSGHKSWWVAVLVGGVSWLWTTRTLIRNLTFVNAHVWAAPVRRPRQKAVLTTTLEFAGLWVLAFGADAGIHKFDKVVPLGPVIAFVLESAVFGAAWLVICLRLPDSRTSWTDLLPGCALFGVGFAVLNLVSRVYLPYRISHASEMYGTLGVAATILAWLLIIGQVIVSAGLVNSIWAEHRRSTNSA